MEKFAIKNGKKLRYGYTTGTCAAAAAAAAATMLLTGQRTDRIQVRLPGGAPAVMEIEDVDLRTDRASCSVVKDGGDDPDVTHGTKIFATVALGNKKSREAGKSDDGAPVSTSIQWENLILQGGKGVGTVTAKGLQCAPGEPAINPVPRKMIFENVKRVCKKYGCSLQLTIEISVPDGTALAKKTYNPRLGIEGGISILGTTGIVDPMSEKALIDTIKTVVDQQFEQDREQILISPGNYGRDFCREILGLDIESAVPISNFIGEALDYIKYKGFKRILLVGHTGKLIKIAAGIMNTHSSYADGRMEVIGVHSAICGAHKETVKKIMECVTTDEAFDLISRQSYYEQVKDRIMDKVLYHLNFRLKQTAEIQVVMFTSDRQHMIKSSGADQMIEILRNRRRK